MVVFNRYVEIGRVVEMKKGLLAGKLVVIIDVIDQNRALVCAPGLARQAAHFKHMALTSIKIDLQRNARTGTVTKAWAAQKVDDAWKATNSAKRQARQQARASMTDLDRFQVMIEKKNRAAKIRQAVNKAKAKAVAK